MILSDGFIKERFVVKLNILAHVQVMWLTNFNDTPTTLSRESKKLDMWGGDKIPAGGLYSYMPLDIITEVYWEPKYDHTILHYLPSKYLSIKSGVATQTTYDVYVRETPKEIYRLLELDIFRRASTVSEYEQFWRGEGHAEYFQKLLLLKLGSEED